MAWEFHDALMTFEGEIDSDTVDEVTLGLGLDLEWQGRLYLNSFGSAGTSRASGVHLGVVRRAGGARGEAVVGTGGPDR